MDLQEPDKKMSKSSENKNGFISMDDDDKTILNKIKKAVTDSLGVVSYSDEQKGIKNLIEIYSKCSGYSIENIVKDYEGKGYGQFKKDVSEAVIETVSKVRDKTEEYLSEKNYLEKVYKEGAIKAELVAKKTLYEVYEKIGFVGR